MPLPWMPKQPEGMIFVRDTTVQRLSTGLHADADARAVAASLVVDESGARAWRRACN